MGEARRLVCRLLTEADREDLSDAAALLVSEVVTNALLHAGTDIDVAAALTGERLRVEVADGSGHLPIRRQYATTSGTGRGMMMLESMVDDWGVSRHKNGKTVWFELTRDDVDPAYLVDSGEERTRAGTAGALVELRNVPLLMHAAWQEHAEALLREYLLVSLEQSAAEETAIQRHADATEAIALLEESIPTVDVAIEPDRLMGDATEPRVSSAVVELLVPRASVAHFATLDQTLTAALEMSEAGRLFTPTTQPEIQSFRRWLCGQVVGQADGEPPVPWAFTDEHGNRAHPISWNLAKITNASVPRVASDQSNTILAVSPALVTLLGYDDASELLGRRIVTIVPERYRQAHVAGFTLYLLVGRQPLLERSVAVPALRRDGSEVTVQMEVRIERLADGMPMFLADLKPV